LRGREREQRVFVIRLAFPKKKERKKKEKKRKERKAEEEKKRKRRRQVAEVAERGQEECREGVARVGYLWISLVREKDRFSPSDRRAFESSGFGLRFTTGRVHSAK
jgi:hypothetical protein